ncbi:MAG: aldose 1-epimerase [Planctomycetes bacterium]|nr:aldose 1-epimerase [Planctomycetota bacterium]
MSASAAPSVSTGKIGNVPVIVLTDPASESEAQVAPLAGFNCFRFLRRVGGHWIPILFSTDSEEALRKGGTGFGFPLLFPFPNRVKDGKYGVRGKTYQLDVNHRTNHIHGLVINREWKRVRTGVSEDRGATVTGIIEASDYPDEILRQFPFPFRLTVTYGLKDGQLAVDARVENTGDGVLPMGFGSHPYFPIPILPGGRREDCEILIPAKQYWELESSIPTGKRLPVSGRLDARSFRPLGEETYDDVLTDVIVTGGGSSCVVRDPRAKMQVRIWADAGFREWVVYAPKGRDLLAFEPYTCATDAVNLNARGMDAGWLELGPGEAWSGRQEVRLVDDDGRASALPDAR